MRIDADSGWSTAPPAARACGDEAYRAFDDQQQAFAFLQRSVKLAAKVRRYRARQRDGLVVLKIVVPEHAVAGFLIESGRLTDREALDRRRLEAAAGEALADLAGEWTPENSETGDVMPELSAA